MPSEAPRLAVVRLAFVIAMIAAPAPAMSATANTPATKFLWSHYPDAVRRWIARHGGLKPQTIYLGGHELAAMFPTCR